MRLIAGRLILMLALAAMTGTLRAAEPFKPFKLKSLDGAARTLADYPGKVTLVSFFFPTCAFCNAEFPHLRTLVERYKSQGLSVVLINVVPGENKLIAGWLEKNQYDFPVLTGASQASLQRDYKLKSTPTHFLLDAAGNILYTRTGYKSGDDDAMEQQVQAALGQPAK